MYQLRTQLIGHQDDVRSVVTGDLGIVTGSRDKTIRIWKEAEDGQFADDTVLVGHSDFVSSLAIPPESSLPQLPQASLVSGSRDCTILLWDVKEGQPAATLKGHKYQVSCVAVGRHSDIISTSHDGTIRIYSGQNFDNVVELSDHQGPVQCVLVLEDGDFLTGSNDTTVKLWSNGTCKHTFKGHTDTVRSLALLPGVGVVSASHDMTLKLWDFQGNVVSHFIGHTAIIYNVATSSSGLIASASEDFTARIWQASGENIAVIQHPGCVWDVAFLPNLDLVSACSDFVARIWTNDSSRAAPQDVQEDLQKSIQAKSKPEKSQGQSSALPAGLNLEAPSALQYPGNRDGQIKVINENGNGMAYSYNLVAGSWEKIGQVTGGEGGDMEAGKSELDGEHYDQVIDVDIDDNRPRLKLGVNNDDNPYDAADRFIQRNSLPEVYREQIVQFIVQNTAVTMPVDMSVNLDPFTGGGAYIPSSSSNNPNQSLQSPTNVTGGGADPFTGRRQSQQEATSSSQIPATTMIIFDNPLKRDAVGSKIRSLSLNLANASDTSGMALTEAEIAPHGVLDRLLASASAASRGSVSRREDEIALLKKLLHWPKDSVFPAFDIARLIIFDEETARRLAANAGPVGLSPTGTLGPALAMALKDPPLPANHQTSLRFLCNTFRSSQLRSWVLSQLHSLLEALKPSFECSSKIVRSSASAFLLNVSIQSQTESIQGEALGKLGEGLSELLSDLSNEETLQRTCLAIGTLASSKEGKQSLKENNTILERLKDLQTHMDEKLQSLSQKALEILAN